MIAGILTVENMDALLKEARFKSKSQIEAIVARYHPLNYVRDWVKAVYVKASAAKTGSCDTAGAEDSRTRSQPSSRHVSLKSTASTTAGDGVNSTASSSGKNLASTGDNCAATQILEKKFRLEFAISPEVMAKIQQAKLLLSKKFPKGVELEQLLNTLLDEYLDNHCPGRR
jgi:hypothetical protein